MLAAFCTHRSKMRRFHPGASLSPYDCDTFSTHYTDSVTTKLQEAVSSMSTIQWTCAAAVLRSRIGYCESTDAISRHHPDLNLKYQTCLIWSGWPRFVYEQIGRCKVRSVNASHYQIIRAEHRNRSRCSTRFFLRFSGGGNQNQLYSPSVCKHTRNLLWFLRSSWYIHAYIHACIHTYKHTYLTWEQNI